MDRSAPIRCILVDDEPLAIRLLADYIEKTPGLELVFSTTHPLQALDQIRCGVADAVFLDVQMPQLNGVDLMKMIRHSGCRVILTTAYTQYAFEGYEHDVVDYLLKPITYQRWSIAIAKLRERIGSAAVELFVRDPVFIKTGHRIQRIDLDSIYYIEGLRDYIAFHTTGGKFLTLENLKEMETLLPADSFIRIHRSYIINKFRLDYLEKGRVVIGKDYLPIGDTYKEEVLARLTPGMRNSK
jgi:DNA-binding LytR/AlgR family response regulator